MATPANAADLPPPNWRLRLRRFRRTRAMPFWERTYPFAIGVLLGASTWRLTLTPEQRDALAGNVLPIAVSVASILAGFQATAQAILLSMIKSKAVEFLKQTGHYPSLVRYFWHALLSLFLFVVFSLFVLCLHALRVNLDHWYRLLTSLIVTLLTSSLLASFRITRLMIRLLTVSGEDPQGHVR